MGAVKTRRVNAIAPEAGEEEEKQVVKERTLGISTFTG